MQGDMSADVPSENPTTDGLIEATETSYGFFRSGLKRFFREEGCLREHTFWDGRYIDVMILAVYRDTWVEQAETLRRLLEHRESDGVRPPGRTAIAWRVQASRIRVFDAVSTGTLSGISTTLDIGPSRTGRCARRRRATS
jgi:hypothetical protein